MNFLMSKSEEKLLQSYKASLTLHIVALENLDFAWHVSDSFILILKCMLRMR